MTALHPVRIVVYLSEEEAAALDAHKLALFRQTGQRIDRGRIIREALADMLAPYMQDATPTPERDQT